MSNLLVVLLSGMVVFGIGVRAQETDVASSAAQPKEGVATAATSSEDPALNHGKNPRGKSEVEINKDGCIGCPSAKSSPVGLNDKSGWYPGYVGPESGKDKTGKE
jgi:hypothetical protein